MKMLNTNLLRLLASACFFTQLTLPANAQDADDLQNQPVSAVELVDPQTILDNILLEEADSNEQNDNLKDNVPIAQQLPHNVSIDGEKEGLIAPFQISIEEVASLIDEATGIGDLNYDAIVGDTGTWSAETFFEPIETKPTANALVKNASDTPKIYWAIKDYLTQDEFPLTAEEKAAILSIYFDREGELMFVSDENRYDVFQNTKRDVRKQGLPSQRYEFDLPRSFDPIKKLALAEIEGAAFVLKYGKDMERGIVAPNSLGSQFDLVPEGRGELALLKDFANSSDPNEFFMDLEPNDPDYATLKAELAKYEELYQIADAANIPPVPEGKTLKIGTKSEAVAILRQRLDVLGFSAQYPVIDLAPILDDLRSDVVELVPLIDEGDEVVVDQVAEVVEPLMIADEFDVELAEALREYQQKAGLLADGIAGPQTLKTINSGPRAQMAPLLVALERHRWGAEDRSGRQIYVNLANYMAEVRDDNAKTFETRVVIGKNTVDRRTPEFHDEMEYLVINPEWNVPHSIGTKEMLPKLQNGGSLGSTMKMLNSRGQRVNMANVDFNKFTPRTFPYRFVQESGPSNALGKVKFIFPNKHNIYLHDTPAKSLFAQSYRAYSHGCVRVRDPIDLATHLMAPYFKNPRATFYQIRSTKKQRFVEMTTRIPVFITYFTTYVDDEGVVRRAKDVYGRDRLVKNALAEQGVIF